LPTMCIVHAGFGGFQAFVARKINHCKLIGNRCVFPHDTIHSPEYAGKLNLYLNLLDQQVKMKDENPSIGIILCAEKDSFEVEFSLKNFQKPIGVAEYHLTKELPDKLKGKLPSAIELKQYLKDKYGFENDENKLL
ncbi:MAG: PDDEXK nuclease domain-containing protein, partial [Bacteroidota bacterium]|nr:PDDEXK nuclease domain-containing protein [Bacteroidota bacterium]